MDFEIRISFCHRIEFLFVSRDIFAIRIEQHYAQEFPFVLRLFQDGSKRRDADAASDEDVFLPCVAYGEVAVANGDFNRFSELEWFEGLLEGAYVLWC